MRSWLTESFLATWVKRVAELKTDKAKLKKSMEPNVAAAVQNKRILVFEEMLKATGFPDLGVVDELKLGAKLTGGKPTTGMLPGKFSPGLASEDGLRPNAMHSWTLRIRVQVMQK